MDNNEKYKNEFQEEFKAEYKQRFTKKFKKGFSWLFAGIFMVTIMGFATMFLWNWLIPTIFNGAVITFWQAIGLLALGKLLTGFGGMGRHSWKGKHGWSGHGMHDRSFWRNRMEQKMQHMSPEEKEKFKTYYYDRCGWRFGEKDTKGEDLNTKEAN